MTHCLPCFYFVISFFICLFLLVFLGKVWKGLIYVCHYNLCLDLPICIVQINHYHVPTCNKDHIYVFLRWWTLFTRFTLQINYLSWCP